VAIVHSITDDHYAVLLWLISALTAGVPFQHFVYCNIS